MVLASRVAVLALVMAAALAQSGCGQIATERIYSNQSRLKTETDSSLKALSSKEAAKLADALTGEVQSVYPSDIGLARVFGQVANLGDEDYSRVKFNVVVEAGENQAPQVVGAFSVDDMSPGTIKPFDIQTSLPMGDIKSLKVVVAALR
jgi:hypothetical protein